MNQRSNTINQMPQPTPHERTAAAPDRGGRPWRPAAATTKFPVPDAFTEGKTGGGRTPTYPVQISLALVARKTDRGGLTPQ